MNFPNDPMKDSKRKNVYFIDPLGEIPLCI